MVVQPRSPVGGRTPSRVSLRDGAEQLLLIGRIGDRPFAVPVLAVERILPMAAVATLPEARPGVMGVLNLSGSVLPVVDARPRLGLPRPEFHPDQRLLVVSAETRYLLWMDSVERIVSSPAQSFDTVEVGTERMLVPFVVCLDGEVIPVLSPEALDPGPILRPAGA
ncbi:MAG: chemotaxis protein CheW [Chloroflexi bacterium]|nr:chemotaxis protein CheW [Chloroflexota bacterium]